MDPVCPPSTVYGAFNAYAHPDKSIVEYPWNEHEGGQLDHEARKLSWALERVGRVSSLSKRWGPAPLGVGPEGAHDVVVGCARPRGRRSNRQRCRTSTIGSLRAAGASAGTTGCSGAVDATGR